MIELAISRAYTSCYTQEREGDSSVRFDQEVQWRQWPCRKGRVSPRSLRRARRKATSAAAQETPMQMLANTPVLMVSCSHVKHRAPASASAKPRRDSHMHSVCRYLRRCIGGLPPPKGPTSTMCQFFMRTLVLTSESGVPGLSPNSSLTSCFAAS